MKQATDVARWLHILSDGEKQTVLDTGYCSSSDFKKVGQLPELRSLSQLPRGWLSVAGRAACKPTFCDCIRPSPPALGCNIETYHNDRHHFQVISKTLKHSALATGYSHAMKTEK